MRSIKEFFEFGSVIPTALVAGAVVAVLGTLSFVVLPLNEEPVADMRIEPNEGVFTVGENFVVTIVVSSKTPVNVFSGELLYDTNVLSIESIDYNTSVADLWAERPWYSNGDGTLNFVGGSLDTGGFVGTDTLITVTFKTKQNGTGTLALSEARILMHDGFGTDASLYTPIEAIFTVEEEVQKSTIIAKSTVGTNYNVVEKKPSTDLNGDGKQTIADVSIFMLHLSSGNERSDFNLDGSVNTKDLSIILDVK